MNQRIVNENETQPYREFRIVQTGDKVRFQCRLNEPIGDSGWCDLVTVWDGGRVDAFKENALAVEVNPPDAWCAE